MDKQKFMDALAANRFAVSYFDTGEEAAEYLDRIIDGRVVGFGDSATLDALGLYDKLRGHNEVHDPSKRTSPEEFLSISRDCLSTEIFLTSCNAASETGELVNVDGTGNRVAGSLFGHQKVYFVLGINKLEPTLERAIWRARNIAAPKNAQRLGKKTPCAVKADRCYDCKSPDRICNGMLIYHKKMSNMEMEVVLIGEELGL